MSERLPPPDVGTRRAFLRGAAVGGVGLGLGSLLTRLQAADPPLPPAREGVARPPGPAADAGDQVPLAWLDGHAPLLPVGVSWGVPWAAGSLQRGQPLAVRDGTGRLLPTQAWPLAYWPDGSVKWSGLAITGGPACAGALQVVRAVPPAPEAPVRVAEHGDRVDIDAGGVRCSVPRQGPYLIRSLVCDGREVGRDARLVLRRADRSAYDSTGILREERFVSRVEQVAVEQAGPVRAVVCIQGRHAGEAADRAWLPFTVRLYVTAGSPAIRIVHSIVYDGDPAQDFIRGLGIAFRVPLREELQNRHLRLAGEEQGIWAEPVRMSPSYREVLVAHARAMAQAQLEGRRIGDLAQLGAHTADQFRTVAAWDAVRLHQLSPDSYAIAKRTGAASSWLHVTNGGRARGTAYLGDVSGGLAIGVRHFWEKYPTGLAIDGATTDLGELTAWFWSPEAPAMDLRHYDTIGHDGRISYEDWEPGYSTPVGVANTSELTLWALPATPDAATLNAVADISAAPALLTCAPERYHAIPVFGVWSLPDRSTPEAAVREEQLDRAWTFFDRQIEQRRWYGFWDYGDVMRTYDPMRHRWMYDIGGHAWNNTELLPNAWLWYAFLRGGGAEAFRRAEAMTRNTGEVDVYHAGRFVGLGSRHNVSHWGCSAKEARISQAHLKRFFYYLTTDERTGDLMREVLDVDLTIARVQPLRKELVRADVPYLLRVGPDWLAMASNWMTEWERTGDPRYREYVLTGMRCLGAMPDALIARMAFRYDPRTKELFDIGAPNMPASEFLVLFGGDQVAWELIQLIDCPSFATAWNRLCAHRGRVASLTGYSAIRLAAYTAWIEADPALAARARAALAASMRADGAERFPRHPEVVVGPGDPRPCEEIASANTPGTAQWALTAIATPELLRRLEQAVPAPHPA